MDPGAKSKIVGGVVVLVVIVVGLGGYFLMNRGPSCSITTTEPQVKASSMKTFEESRAKIGFAGYLKFSGNKEFIALNLESVKVQNINNIPGLLNMYLNFDCGTMTVSFKEDLQKKEYKSRSITMVSEKMINKQFRCKIQSSQGIISGSKGEPFKRDMDLVIDCQDEYGTINGDQIVIKSIFIDLYNKEV